MTPHDIGKLIIGIGAALLGIGVLVLLLGRVGLFRLPGDIHVGGKNWQVYFPIVSCIILSVLLTLILWIINSFRK